MESVIVNKIAESGLITIDLKKFLTEEETALFDIKDFLFMNLILKEKDYREALKNLNWQVYTNKNVCITCTADAIIPLWAYMLATVYLKPVAKDIFFGTESELQKMLLLKNISQINVSDYVDTRVVIKGCGDKAINEAAYVEVTKILLPVVKSIMYGEPCSTVPIYKKSKA